MVKNMGYCVHCGGDLVDEDVFCPNCGTQTLVNHIEFDTISHENLRLQKNVKAWKRSFIVACIVTFAVIGFFTYQLFQVAETSKFTFYYAALSEQRYGVDDVEAYLNQWQWVEGTYMQGIFDCSEMSAYLEWKLENEGFHTVMVVGPTPSNPETFHAWLLVETSDGTYMPIEATQFTLVNRRSPYFDSYFEYDYRFETIYDALEYNYQDFNWWEI